jgi:hypothetical protein
MSHHPSGNTVDQDPFWNVASHDGASADKGTRPNLHVVDDRGAKTDPSSAPDRNASG